MRHHTKQSGFAQNIVIIVILLAIVFLSQQTYAQPYGKKIFTQISQKTSEYSQKAGNWLKAKISPNISQEVQSRGEKAKEELILQKNNALQNIWENIKNYFAEKFSKTFGTEVK